MCLRPAPYVPDPKRASRWTRPCPARRCTSRWSPAASGTAASAPGSPTGCTKHLIDSGIDTDLIDLAELTVPQSLADHPDVADFAARIEAADAVIVVTPEDNHSYPGPLKTAIDAVRAPWRAKPVAFVSYGGLSGGLRAVEALRSLRRPAHRDDRQHSQPAQSVGARRRLPRQRVHRCAAPPHPGTAVVGRGTAHGSAGLASVAIAP